MFIRFGNIAGIVTHPVVGYTIADTGSFDLARVFVGAHCLITIFAFMVVAGPIRRLELAA